MIHHQILWVSKKRRTICIPVRSSTVRQETAEGVPERRHVMQVVDDDDARSRAPAARPETGSDVIVGCRRACALLDDVGEVLAQFAA